MTKSKIFECLKVLAYVIGFPLMSLIMLITFIPMLDAEFMGNFAVIWIVVTLAIWAFVAIIQYILYVTLSKNGGVKRNIANIIVLVIAILSILLPGAIFGAVQAKNYNEVVAAAQKEGIELQSRKSLMGWFKGFTDKDDNAIIQLEDEINDFIYAYGLKGYETEKFGSAADNAAGIGYYPGVKDKINDELKRKADAYAELQEVLAARQALVDANNEILAPLQQAYDDAVKAVEEQLPVLQDAYNNFYGVLNTASGVAQQTGTQANVKLNLSGGVKEKINAAITAAKAILGENATPAADATIADKLTAAFDELLPLMRTVLDKADAIVLDAETVDKDAAKAFDDAVNAFNTAYAGVSGTGGIMEDLDAVITDLSVPVTADNAQTVLNQATSALEVFNAQNATFTEYKGNTTTEGTIDYYEELFRTTYGAKNTEIIAITNSADSSKAALDAKIAELVPTYYPYDGYPTSIPLVFSETVYVGELQTPVKDSDLMYYELDETSGNPTGNFLFGYNLETTSIESSTPFSYTTYKAVQALVLDMEGNPTFAIIGYEANTDTTAAKAKVKKSIPLVDTLLNALGVDYPELTKNINTLDELAAADIEFTRPGNVDQIMQLVISMLPKEIAGIDIEKLLGKSPTYDDLNGVVELLYNYIYPVGEGGVRVPNASINQALYELIGVQGILDMLMPMWDLHNAWTITETQTKPDYISGLLLTLGWAVDQKLGLGETLYGALPQSIDIVIGNGSVALAQAEYDSGYSVEQLKALQYKLDNYPQVIAFANFWHVCIIFSGIVLLSLLLTMYFARKQKQYFVPEPDEE